MAKLTTPTTPLHAWRCASCTLRALRTFSSTTTLAAIGPENPKYIPFPVPPQQDGPDNRFIKGRLPVPRDIFAGSRGQDKASEAWLAPRTQAPSRTSSAAPGSREEWKNKMSAMRRRNLREGLTGLRQRKTEVDSERNAKFLRQSLERNERLNRPISADERLTLPSTGLDLEELYHGPLRDPGRAERLAAKRANVALRARLKREERFDSLNTLFLAARRFIVTPAQLDEAVEAAFGTPENPVTFGGRGESMSAAQRQYGFSEQPEPGRSVWALGKPQSVQDMLKEANRAGRARKALDSVGGVAEVNRERVRRIAEALTGGRMDDGEEARR